MNRPATARSAPARSGGRGGDAGNAIVLAVGITAVALSLGTTVVTTGVVVTQASGTERQRTSLIAAAESGIDLLHAQLDASTTDWPCSSPQTLAVNSGSDPSTVTVTLEYLTSSGTPTTCTGDPAVVVVTSTAVAGRSLRGGTPPHRTMRAGLSLTSAVPHTTLNAAVFGNGGVTGTNQLFVHESSPGAMDADLYSNSGDVVCQNQGGVQGDIVTQSNVIMGNNCTASGPVWAGGRFSAPLSAIQVAGDVYAAASTSDPAGIEIGNSAGRIAGNAFTNGDVVLHDASVGGSVLSTQGKITFQNGAHIDGSAYSRLGLYYTTGGGGSVGHDVVVSAGSIGSGATSQNPGEESWSIGEDATASPSGCVTNTVAVGGAVSPAVQPLGVSCPLPSSSLSPEVTFPAAPDNPSGVSSPVLPGTVPAPPVRPFPTLYSRTVPSTGQDALDAWRSAGWDVQVFSGDGVSDTSCTDALTYLQQAESTSGAHHSAWVAAPLVIVISGCNRPFRWDDQNRSIMNGGDTFTLYNDLAVIADRGMDSQNGFFVRSDPGTTRNLMWIVPSDSPDVAGGCPAWSSWGDLLPSGISTTDVAWLLLTPCDAAPQNNFGSSDSPITGAVYGGTVSFQQAHLRFVPMEIPGLDDGSSVGSQRTVTLSYKREVVG